MEFNNKRITFSFFAILVTFLLIGIVNEASAKTVFHSKKEKVKVSTPMNYNEWYAKQFDDNGMLLGAEDYIKSCIAGKGSYTKVSAMPTELKNASTTALVKINSSIVPKYQIKPLTNNDFLFYVEFKYKENYGTSKNLLAVFACYFEGYDKYAKRIYLGVEDLDKEKEKMAQEKLNEKVQESMNKVDSMYGYAPKQ
jgi:hypothetical protein